MNYLYFGDNLDILRRFVKDESVDLIYLDPPFNSKRDYNAVFTGKGGQKATAQVQAFEDTWCWDDSAASAYDELVFKGTNARAAEFLISMRKLLGTNDMLAYLTMMTIRMVELHRVLKPTGSIYLHCDSTMSHYLKIMMDSIFGCDRFRNDIGWKRSAAHNDTKSRYGRVTDRVLFYVKAKGNTFNTQYTPYSQEYIDDEWNLLPSGRYYKAENMLDPQKKMAEFDFMGTRARWRTSHDGLLELWNAPQTEVPNSHGRIKLGKNGLPIKRCRIVFLDELPGVPLQDIWSDIKYIAGKSGESLGYPTQKPTSLLERILKVSSNEGDVILDPFCGCGTTIAAAQRLNRQWIGIDITHLAVNLIKTRLIDTFGDGIRQTFRVFGEPTTLEDAVALAEQDKYQFQFWSLGLVGARPESADEKKGADKGIDGKRFFSDEVRGTHKTVIISVKGGQTIPANSVRDLRGTIEREGAEIGVLISLAAPTKSMREDAAAAGLYTSAFGTTHMRIQLLTIEELMNGKNIDLPSHNHAGVQTFKRAKRIAEDDKQEGLGL